MRCLGICGAQLFELIITICDIPEALMPSPDVHTYINTNHGQKQVMQMCEQAACTFLLLFA